MLHYYYVSEIKMSELLVNTTSVQNVLKGDQSNDLKKSRAIQLSEESAVATFTSPHKKTIKTLEFRFHVRRFVPTSVISFALLRF